MSQPELRVPRILKGLQQRLDQIDLREHEDKILLMLALVISASIGLIVVGFVAITERLSDILLSAGGWQRFLSPLVGSLVAGWLLYRFFPEARGSGIPQTRVALILQGGFISLRTVIGKFICSGISLGSGIALGREGPSVHIGAGIASVAGRRLGLSESQVRSLIPVGTAAAVAAAFNTPLAAVLFTLEEILADLHARLVGAVVIGAATSWIVLRLILGDEPLFHVPAYQLVHPVEFLIYALLGVLGGLVSAAFVRLLLWQRAQFLKTPPRWKPFAPAVGGLLVALLALAVPGVLGVGYNLVSEALNGQMAVQMMMLLLALKIITTSTCYSSGNAGGIFGPSLFIGAMLGGAVGDVAHTLLPELTGNAGAYALVGMGAAFAGIVRTPMTSVIMIFEITRDYTIIVPLMIANLCSYLLSQKLQKVPIYESLSKQDGIIMPSAAHRREPLTVARAMKRDTAEQPATPFVHTDDPLDTALQRMGEAGIDRIAVVSRTGAAHIGTVSVQDALAAYQQTSNFAQKEAAASSSRSLRHLLPLVAAITVVAVLIVSGLVVWQRSRRTDRGLQAYQAGTELLARGQADAAVMEFRTSLAETPQNVRARAALGLALIQSGHFPEAASYLSDVAKAEPGNGPVWVGLAEVARASGDFDEALRLFRQALSKEWPPGQEAQRTNAQLIYATLLADTGQSAEAISLLLSLVQQSGDNPTIAKQAADLVRSIGSPDKAEEAYASLAASFPADASVWMRLGDARFAADKETAALEAYRRAVAVDANNAEATSGVARVQAVLALDPTRPGIRVRDRARRWDEILQRVVTAASMCGSSPELEKAKPLLSRPATSLEASDKKMEAALAIWSGTEESCKSDTVLMHILSKLRDARDPQ